MVPSLTVAELTFTGNAGDFNLGFTASPLYLCQKVCALFKI